ncbi:MAG: DUF2800 domain-containing protein [Syntrophomonas sp.]
MSHALLSASGSARWMSCTPSARLEEQFSSTTSAYAEEGSFAHALAELKLSRAIANTIKPSAYNKRLAELKKDPLFSPAMEEYIDQYVAQVSEIFMKAKKQCADTLVLLEQKLDFSEWVPEGYGTGDVVIISDGVLEVIDLKYGKGVPVSAEGNSQTRLYGLGAIDSFDMLYKFSTVRMTIIQPRLDSISTEELTLNDLWLWGENELQPKAKLAYAGDGEFCAGDHCKFCRAKATCKARADYNLELAKYDFQDAFLLSKEEVADVLARADQLKAWVTDLETYALEQARDHGEKFPGWKLVEGRSNRKYTDEFAVGQTLVGAGYEEDQIHKEPQLLGITDMEKLLGKKKFGELLSELVMKPAGKPVLVPESDKRPEINSLQSAIDDFSEAAV